MLNKPLKQEKVCFLGFNLAKGKSANSDMLKIVV